MDTLPAGVDVRQRNRDELELPTRPGTVTCNRTGGNLAPGRRADHHDRRDRTGYRRGTITNSATVSSPNDNTPGNNTATATTTIDNQGTVSGTKFMDPNGDGNLADGTVPAGPTPWTIRAYTDVAVPVLVTSTTTNATTGAYSLSLDPGNYIICEVVQATWMQSAPSNTNCSAISGVGTGGSQGHRHLRLLGDGQNFGNFQQGTVSGTKFNDPNGDGNLGDGTVPAGPTGWTIRAYTDVATPVLVTSTTTNTTTGAYSLSLNPGNYIICEVVQSGWAQSAPANTFCSAISGVAAGGHKVTVTSASSAAAKDFGNQTRGSISGQKFNDHNGNGMDNGAGDEGLGGWTIFLDANSNSILDGTETSTTTSSAVGFEGLYSFTNLAPGTYRVCEVLQAGWTQTSTPTCHSVTLLATAPTNAVSKDFGNLQVSATIDVEKSVSVTGPSGTFVDADSPTGPTLLDGFDEPVFRFVITNTGNVPLSSVSLSDDDAAFDFGDCATPVPTTLAVGASYTCELSIDWTSSQHTDTATASGSFTGSDSTAYPASDTDKAHYFGAGPALAIDKEGTLDIASSVPPRWPTPVTGSTTPSTSPTPGT